jgi:hypothetical protein
MQKRSSKQDFAQNALRVVQQATGETLSETLPDKNPAAVALGRLGGLKGGKARAKRLTAEERSTIAKKAAAGRWGKSR